MAREITQEEYLREKNKKEVSINEFRKIVKEAGYKLKIKSIECMGSTAKYGEIFKTMKETLLLVVVQMCM